MAEDYCDVSLRGSADSSVAFSFLESFLVCFLFQEVRCLEEFFYSGFLSLWNQYVVVLESFHHFFDKVVLPFGEVWVFTQGFCEAVGYVEVVAYAPVEGLEHVSYLFCSCYLDQSGLEHLVQVVGYAAVVLV